VWRVRVVDGGLFRAVIVAPGSPEGVSVEGGVKSVGPCGERPSVLAGNQRTGCRPFRGVVCGQPIAVVGPVGELFGDRLVIGSFGGMPERARGDAGEGFRGDCRRGRWGIGGIFGDPGCLGSTQEQGQVHCKENQGNRGKEATHSDMEGNTSMHNNQDKASHIQEAGNEQAKRVQGNARQTDDTR